MVFTSSFRFVQIMVKPYVFIHNTSYIQFPVRVLPQNMDKPQSLDIVTVLL